MHLLVDFKLQAFYKKAVKRGKIFQLICNLLSERQIKWKIVSD